MASPTSQFLYTLMHQLLYPATLGSFFVLFGIGILNTERNFLGNINFLFSVIFLLYFILISQAINNIKNKRDSFKYNVLNYISAIIYLVGFLINMFFSEEKFGKYFNYGIATINLILVVIFSYLLIIEQNIIGRNK